MEYGKNKIEEFAEMLQESIQSGASQSDIIQMITDWQLPLVEYVDRTVGLLVTDKPDIVQDKTDFWVQSF